VRADLELFQRFHRLRCRAAKHGCSLLSARSSPVNKSRLEKRLQPISAALPGLPFPRNVHQIPDLIVVPHYTCGQRLDDLVWPFQSIFDAHSLFLAPKK
jgi:hypothetical protein